MNKSLLLLTLPLVACNTAGERADSGQCPAGETCSAETPNGLHFIGAPFADQFFLDGPSPTAIGGTQDVSIEYDDDGLGGRVPLDLPYRADDDGALGVKVVAQAGADVTVRGVGSRKNYLRIVDRDTGELFDRYQLTGAAVDTLELLGTGLEQIPTGPGFVWGPGHQEIAVALSGAVQVGDHNEQKRLVDTSMRLDLPGATRTGWDSIAFDATPGSHVLDVTAGDKPAAQLPVEVVAGADAMALFDAGPPVIAPHSSSTVCFKATNAGRYVLGLTWRFDVDGEVTTQGGATIQRNCVVLDAHDLGSGSIHVVASAGGQQLAVDVAVVQALAPARAQTKARPANGTAGERAAL